MNIFITLCAANSNVGTRVIVDYNQGVGQPEYYAGVITEVKATGVKIRFDDEDAPDILFKHKWVRNVGAHAPSKWEKEVPLYDIHKWVDVDRDYPIGTVKDFPPGRRVVVDYNNGHGRPTYYAGNVVKSTAKGCSVMFDDGDHPPIVFGYAAMFLAKPNKAEYPQEIAKARLQYWADYK